MKRIRKIHVKKEIKNEAQKEIEKKIKKRKEKKEKIRMEKLEERRDDRVGPFEPDGLSEWAGPVGVCGGGSGMWIRRTTVASFVFHYAKIH